MSVAGAAGDEGLIPTTDRYGTALADIVRCVNCGHMQLARFPAEAELSESYAEAESDDYVEEEAGQRRTAGEILARIERSRDLGSLVDLGCWVGFFADEAAKRGWEVTGVEPSEFASRYAREALGLEVVTGDLLEAELPAASFDVAFMGDVIEHLPDPGAALDRISHLLVPGGMLAMAVPDAGSRLARVMGRRWWSVIPTHVHYFTRRSITILLERHGYDLAEISTAPKSFTVGYYLERAGGYSRGLARALVGAAERVRVADRLWAPDFRDRMLVLARREGAAR